MAGMGGRDRGAEYDGRTSENAAEAELEIG